MQPLISIIVPTYNSGDTLSIALSSIVSQIFQDFEVVIIDGQSTDNTILTINRYHSLKLNTKWVSEPDKGIYDAMNKGVNLASGSWIYFLGSDDYLHDENVLKDIAAILTSTEADFVYGDAIVSSNGQRHDGEVDLMVLLTKRNICHQAIFYRRSVFDKVGFYNLKYPVVADWDFNIRCFQNDSIKKEYITRDIVVFNNVTGVSSLHHTDPFYDMVPATYIKELNKIKQEKNDIISSRSYKIGVALYGLLKRAGIVMLLNKFRN